MSPVRTSPLVQCGGCGERFPEPDDPTLVVGCDWHQLWEPAVAEEVPEFGAAVQAPAEEVVDGEVVPEYAVIPYTGEALTLRDMSFAQLGKVLDAARVFERSSMREFKQALQQEILGRMDANAADGVEGAWTVHEDGWTLSGDSPDRTDYDLGQLRAKLGELVKAGTIKQEAVDKVIVPDGWKVAKRPLGQLAKLGDVKAAIDECVVPVTRPRSVSVSVEVSR